MTGDPTPYSDEDAETLVEYLFSAFGGWDGDEGQMRVTAKIEWAGEYNKRAHRTSWLGPVRLDAVRAAVNVAKAAQSVAQRVSSQRPPRGWHAQIRELTRTKAGYAAADRAGLNVTARTLLGWLSGETTPSKANQAKIERAAIGLQYDRAAGARSKAVRANHAAADALSDALEAEHGADIRLFNIERLDLHDDRD